MQNSCHTDHLKIAFPQYVDSHVFIRFGNVKKLLLHYLHGNGFFPVSTLWCFIRVYILYKMSGYTDHKKIASCWNFIATLITRNFFLFRIYFLMCLCFKTALIVIIWEYCLSFLFFYLEPKFYYIVSTLMSFMYK